MAGSVEQRQAAGFSPDFLTVRRTLYARHSELHPQCRRAGRKGPESDVECTSVSSSRSSSLPAPSTRADMRKHDLPQIEQQFLIVGVRLQRLFEERFVIERMHVVERANYSSTTTCFVMWHRFGSMSVG